MPYIILKKISLFLLFVLTFSRCQQAMDIENFDEASFREDKQACQGIRMAMKDAVLQLPQHLRGLSQQEIQATLGKADRQELSNRSQKYLIYYIEPSPECEDKPSEAEPLTMYVRFNSVGRANEISFKNY